MSENNMHETGKYIFPEDYKYLTFLKKVFRHEFRKNGFKRISTPTIEESGLKQHGEIGIMNAYLKHGIMNEIQPLYYYYISHFFPKKGEEIRIGAEIIGENDPILDAMLIYINYSILNKIGLQDTFSITINSNGIEKEKNKYREELSNFYADKKHILSPESLINLEKDALLLFDSILEDEQILAKNAPSIIKSLKKDSKEHYNKCREYLDLLKIPYQENPQLIAKNDYHSHTIWEIREKQSNTLMVSGGRYNLLAQKCGAAKEIPATGFFTNTDVLINMIKSKNLSIRDKDTIDLFFVQLGDEAKKVVFPLSLLAREAGIKTVVSIGTPSMKEQLLKANRSGAKYIVVVGLMEAKNGVFQVRELSSGTQINVKQDELIPYIITKLGEDALDFYCPAKDLITK